MTNAQLRSLFGRNRVDVWNLRALHKTALFIALVSGELAIAQPAQELFTELRTAGGVHPFAQLVCFPAPGQDLDTTFMLIAFSKDIARSLRIKDKPIPKEFLDAENAPEGDRFLLQWTYRNGVRLHNEPETLDAVLGSKGGMWSTDLASTVTTQSARRFTLRMVFSVSGRYSRDVLVDDVLTTSVYGKCVPVGR